MGTYKKGVQAKITPRHTVGTEFLFLMATIFAAEREPGCKRRHRGSVCLHGIMNNEIYMQIHGQCVDILVHSCRYTVIMFVMNF